MRGLEASVGHHEFVRQRIFDCFRLDDSPSHESVASPVERGFPWRRAPADVDVDPTPASSAPADGGQAPLDRGAGLGRVALAGGPAWISTTAQRVRVGISIFGRSRGRSSAPHPSPRRRPPRVLDPPYRSRGSLSGTRLRNLAWPHSQAPARSAGS